MILSDGGVVLRGFYPEDGKSLAELCNNRNVWNNLRDYIPFPYTEDDAVAYILHCRAEEPRISFAVEWDGVFAGCAGLVLQQDVYRHSAEIGYWLGEQFWGRGIMTKAVGLLAEYGFTSLGLKRIYSGVFAYNAGSCRVLEKNGFIKEGVFRSAVCKNGVFHDEVRYAKVCR